MALKLLRAAYRQWRVCKNDPFPKGFDLLSATEAYVERLVAAGMAEGEAKTAVTRLWRLVASRRIDFATVDGLIGSRITIEESLSKLDDVRAARAAWYLGQA